MAIPGLKDNEDWGISGLSPLPQDLADMRESIREGEEARAVAIGVPGEGFPDVATLPWSPRFGGPPSVRDKARADKTVAEATFGGPRNYTTETAEWPGGKQ